MMVAPKLPGMSRHIWPALVSHTGKFIDIEEARDILKKAGISQQPFPEKIKTVHKKHIPEIDVYDRDNPRYEKHNI